MFSPLKGMIEIIVGDKMAENIDFYFYSMVISSIGNGKLLVNNK